MRVPGAATRKWQASAISNPAPIGVPNSAATTGLRIASMAAIMSSVVGSRVGWPNSEMSAPAMKVRPAQLSTDGFNRVIAAGVL